MFGVALQALAATLHSPEKNFSAQISVMGLLYFEVSYQSLDRAHQRFQFAIVAFCIMSNHFHILIRSKDEQSKIMARINRRYSDYYSKRYRHVGRIYKRWYFAKAIEDPHVLLIVSRYIHRNPIETKIPMVIDLHHYPHSSYLSYGHSSTNQYPYLDTSVLPRYPPHPFPQDGKGFCLYCMEVIESG